MELTQLKNQMNHISSSQKIFAGVNKKIAFLIQKSINRTMSLSKSNFK